MSASKPQQGAPMGQVVQFVPRSKSAADSRRAGKPPAASRQYYYYCTRCSAEQFQLYPSGLVLCASCGARLHNLEVYECPPEYGP